MRLSELVPSLFPIRIFPYNDDVVFYLYYCNIIGEVTLHLAINALLVMMLRDSRCSNSSQNFLMFRLNRGTIFTFNQHGRRTDVAQSMIDPRSEIQIHRKLNNNNDELYPNTDAIHGPFHEMLPYSHVPTVPSLRTIRIFAKNCHFSRVSIAATSARSKATTSQYC